MLNEYISVPLMAYVQASQVKAVDTTGAGDALIGALAFYMSCYPQLSLLEIVCRAVNIATATVTAHGVQSSYPTREDLDDILFDTDTKRTKRALAYEWLDGEKIAEKSE